MITILWPFMPRVVPVLPAGPHGTPTITVPRGLLCPRFHGQTPLASTLRPGLWLLDYHHYGGLHNFGGTSVSVSFSTWPLGFAHVPLCFWNFSFVDFEA